MNTLMIKRLAYRKRFSQTHFARMATTYTILTATALFSLPSYAQVEQLESACLNGNGQACTRLMRVARNECMYGDRDACSYASQLSMYLQQGGQAGTPRQGGSYRGSGHYEEPQYPNDPLRPQDRSLIRSTNDYIRSYCSDPNMAAQLRGFGYCR